MKDAWQTCPLCSTIYMSGHKCDVEKLRMDLLSPVAIQELAGVLTYGAKKYKDRNWETGIKYGRVYAAAMRHLLAWWSGEEYDSESGLSHLSHAMCCLMFLIHYQNQPDGWVEEWDDRPELRI